MRKFLTVLFFLSLAVPTLAQNVGDKLGLSLCPGSQKATLKEFKESGIQKSIYNNLGIKYLLRCEGDKNTYLLAPEQNNDSQLIIKRIVSKDSIERLLVYGHPFAKLAPTNCPSCAPSEVGFYASMPGKKSCAIRNELVYVSMKFDSSQSDPITASIEYTEICPRVSMPHESFPNILDLRFDEKSKMLTTLIYNDQSNVLSEHTLFAIERQVETGVSKTLGTVKPHNLPLQKVCMAQLPSAGRILPGTTKMLLVYKGPSLVLWDYSTGKTDQAYMGAGDNCAYVERPVYKSLNDDLIIEEYINKIYFRHKDEISRSWRSTEITY